jgi:2-hydroxychromene-2-carboxylate isomerase
MSRVCDYYFAPQSPWVYLGHQRLRAMAKAHGVQIDLKPCDLGKVFGVSGGLPLAKQSPQRQAHRLLELKRWSEHLQLPLNLKPKFFPVSGDAAAKLIVATRLALGIDAAFALAGAIQRAVWAEEKNIVDTDALIGIALDCELDGKMLIKSSETASVQAEYERYTEAAISANVFGVPWYIIDDEGYFGQDRLDFVERAFAKNSTA